MEEGGPAVTDKTDTKVSQNEIETASYIKRQLFMDKCAYSGEWQTKKSWKIFSGYMLKCSFSA